MVDEHDQGYQDFLLWAEGYATCYHGETPQTPVATVLSPKHKKKVFLGEPATFEGDGVDPQDGPVPDEALVWTSELLEVPIGQGRGPFDVVLPLGDQVITLSVTDTEGHIGAWTFIVRVREPN